MTQLPTIRNVPWSLADSGASGCIRGSPVVGGQSSSSRTVLQRWKWQQYHMPGGSPQAQQLDTGHTDPSQTAGSFGGAAARLLKLTHVAPEEEYQR